MAAHSGAANDPDPAPTGKTQKVELQVELYDAPNDGNYVGEVPKGTQVTVKQCSDNDMCEIAGGKYAGWIFDGADYDTLDR